MKKFIATSCEFTLHEDDWNEGEGNLIACWNEKLAEADSIVGVLQSVPYLDKGYISNAVKKIVCMQDVFENDPCRNRDYHRFDADLTVDIEIDSHYDGGFRIIKPTEDKWKQFERGEVKLYSLHIVVHVQKLADLDVDDVCNEGWQH